jgi:hypothetical protein
MYLTFPRVRSDCPLPLSQSTWCDPAPAVDPGRAQHPRGGFLRQSDVFFDEDLCGPCSVQPRTVHETSLQMLWHRVVLEVLVCSGLPFLHLRLHSAKLHQQYIQVTSRCRPRQCQQAAKALPPSSSISRLSQSMASLVLRPLTSRVGPPAPPYNPELNAGEILVP